MNTLQIVKAVQPTFMDYLRSMSGKHGYLQFYSDGGEGGSGEGGGEGGEGGEGEGGEGGSGSGEGGGDLTTVYAPGAFDTAMTEHKLDFAKILKENPLLKKAYQDRFNKNMSERLKKYEDIDLEGYEAYKKDKEEGRTFENADSQWKEKYSALERKTSAIDYCMENEFSREQSELITSLLKWDNVQTDDEGKYDFEEEVTRIKTKFPSLFQSGEGEGGEGGSGSGEGKNKYNPGSQKHNNKGGKKDLAEIGRQKALERHKKKEE